MRRVALITQVPNLFWGFAAVSAATAACAVCITSKAVVSMLCQWQAEAGCALARPSPGAGSLSEPVGVQRKRTLSSPAAVWHTAGTLLCQPLGLTKGAPSQQ